MCEQCQAFDDDEDALAAAFVARHGKAAAPAPGHALLDRKAGPKPVLPVKKER